MRAADLHFGQVLTSLSFSKQYTQSERRKETYIHPEEDPFVKTVFSFCFLTLKFTREMIWGTWTVWKKSPTCNLVVKGKDFCVIQRVMNFLYVRLKSRNLQDMLRNAKK